MTIEFDDAAADALIRVAREADGELRDEGVLRRGAAETALEDFEGGHANLFRVAVSVEAGNRGRLAGVLHDLAGQVEVARRKAGEERDRLEQLAGWRLREAERERRRERDAFSGGIGASVDGLFDPRPSDVPIAPPTISASFSAQERHRTAGAAIPGRTSADPERLRVFASQSRASNRGMERQLGRVRDAWARFASGCSWVPRGSASFLSGFERLLAENQRDATWIEGVAAAFEAADGGSLSNRALDLAATAVAPMAGRTLLDALSSLSEKELAALFAASPGLKKQVQLMDPAAICSWWRSMNPPEGAGTRFSERQDLLLSTLPVLFGNLEGIPYAARNDANRVALTAAIADLRARIASASASASGASHDRAADADVKQLTALVAIQNALKSPRGGALRYLTTLTSDRPPLAAVSIGDLDTAANISYAVPGMNTTTKGMTGWTRAAQNLSVLLPPRSAVVAWIGYDTPPIPLNGNVDFGVLDVSRAVAGGDRLTTALGGLAAVRGGSMPRLSIVAHSYGTTTAAVALSQPGGVRVDAFITLGSAGLPDSVHTAADLNAANVYSGHARDKSPGERESGDQWAWIGRDTSRDHLVNPMAPGFGARTFGTDTGGDAGRAVTDHGALLGDGDEAGYLDERTESLRNVVRVISNRTEDITPYVPLGPTNLERAWMEGMKNALG